jgi:hypothetical protein
VFDLIARDNGNEDRETARLRTRQSRYHSRDRRRDYHWRERESAETLSVAASDLSLAQTDDWVRDRGRPPYHTNLSEQPRAPSPVYLRSRDRKRPSVVSTTGVSQTWECQICFEEKPQHEFPSRKITQGCEHEGRLELTDCCTACLERHIVSAFESNMWDDIRCPVCNAQLQHEDMANFAPRDIFER